MRQRKVKNLDEKLAGLSDFQIKDPALYKGKWSELLSKRNGGFQNNGEIENNSDLRGKDETESFPAKIFLEIGCGKGKFLTTHAARDGKSLFLGIEGQDAVILRALERAKELNVANAFFICTFVKDLSEIFAEGELTGIYLNFSDPWPKARHAKRRLTHRNYLKQYERLLQKGGFLEFKTDNDDLFDFTLDEIRESGFETEEVCRDLHGEGREAEAFREGMIVKGSDAPLVTTEYEEKFIKNGKNINFVRLEFK